jgi:hypothetical protein
MLDAYCQSAAHLITNHFEHYDLTRQAQIPKNFVFRDSIELYLKFLKIIFHRELKINYPENRTIFPISNTIKFFL